LDYFDFSGQTEPVTYLILPEDTVAVVIAFSQSTRRRRILKFRRK
jgi:hypothetical protein